MKTILERCLKFLCGADHNGRIDRTSFWTMITTVATVTLLIFAYIQLRGVNETTAAEFSHKIKNDLYTPNNTRLLTLFDDSVLIFKSDSNSNAWFELDTVLYNKMPVQVRLDSFKKWYSALEIDQLLENFEDLAFLEKRGQLNFEYIYDGYAYYIERLWENPQMKKYIEWQRKQPHFSNTYINFENIYKRLKSRTDKEK